MLKSAWRVPREIDGQERIRAYYPVFLQEYRAAFAAIVEDTAQQGKQIVSPELDVLREIMQDTDKGTSARVFTAKAATDFALRLREAIAADGGLISAWGMVKGDGRTLTSYHSSSEAATAKYDNQVSRHQRKVGTDPTDISSPVIKEVDGPNAEILSDIFLKKAVSF